MCSIAVNLRMGPSPISSFQKANIRVMVIVITFRHELHRSYRHVLVVFYFFGKKAMDMFLSNVLGGHREL